MVELGDFIGGAFVVPSAPGGVLRVVSPADLADVVGEHRWQRAHVDRAVEAARSASRAWRRVGPSARGEALRRYQHALTKSADALARCIAREVGKPLWEAKAEVQAMVTKVDVSLKDGAAFTRDVSIDDLPGEIRHRPHGVVAVVGPFNFPGHLPNGQLVPALLTGNTVVFKPSDKAPSTAAHIAACMKEAALPAGVFNVVNGPAPVAEALVTHSGVDAILFTGSAAVGQRIIAANLHRPGVLVALELGGKNASLVLDDADVPRAIRELAFSGFATAGQRCTATSRVIVKRGVAEAVCAGLAKAARSIRVGHVFDDAAFMGPVISEASRDALVAAQQRAVAAGCEVLEAGGVTKVSGHDGWYVRPAVHRAPTGLVVEGYSDVELFGPDVCVTVVDSDEAAIAAANASAFGLAAAVFTSSAERFERCADELRVGVVHWNRSSAGASGRLPFGGVKASGNHRPAGVLMGQSCTYPLAVLKPAPAAGALPTWPGISFE